jgi:phosphatidylglycerol:prolipoprotein diacylglycerol transferase
LAYEPFRRRDGELFALMLTIYPLTRFLLEIIRTDESAIFHTGLSISQNVSLAAMLGVAALWFFILRRPRGTSLAPAAETPEVLPDSSNGK